MPSRLPHPTGLAASLIAVVLLAAGSGAHAESQIVSGSSASASVMFTIRIPVVFRMKVQSQAPLRVTLEDIARGYIETSTPQEVQVTFNVPKSYTLRIDVVAPRFKRVTVSEQAASRSFGTEGLTLHEPPTPPATNQASHRLLYRFELPADMTPGDYPWPIAVSAAQI
ncbi:MAG TPA: hypothetical protein VH105_11610 [Burkholderiales bacterium]|jgi:hypothetical protein|nr:hypothetical protein [Burkholderiales bacterium]